MKPGVYSGMPMADYLRIPAISASVLRALIERCAKAAWHESWLSDAPVAESEVDDLDETLPESDATEAKDIGSIGHAILLEGSTACCEVIDPKNYPAKSTGNVPKGWGNNAIRAARDEARASGKIPVLLPKMAKINAAVGSAREFIESLREKEPAIWAMFQPDGGESELTIVWDEDGLLCKLRADRTNLARTAIVDAKFTGTSAEPDAWGRTKLPSQAISSALYRRGYERTFGTSPDYAFLVIETKAPYLPSMPGVNPHHFALATQKIDFALREWRQCLANNYWPGYPACVVYPEVLPWEEARWQEREVVSFERRLELSTQG